jgi:hypothetical protein
MLRRAALVGALLGLATVLATTRARAQVSLQERLNADCIDRANAPPGLPRGRPLVVRPFVGGTFASSKRGPLLSPPHGLRAEVAVDALQHPGGLGDGLFVGVDGSLGYAPHVQAVDGVLAVGFNRRRFVIWDYDAVAGHCAMFREDARFFLGPWVSALSGPLPVLDTRAGGLLGFAYRRRTRSLGWELMQSTGVVANVRRRADHPNEPDVLLSLTLRGGVYLGPVLLGFEARQTTYELASWLALGFQWEP